jgi:lipopolysaccharide export system permease protein
MIINLSKLSGEYELIVISSFGLSPLKILRVILPVCFMMSVALFIISFIVIPQTDYLQAKFLGQKQQEAEFNIKPSEYGQVFGPWYIYVEGKVGNTYKDITLFLPSETKDTFVMAKTANAENDKDSMKLILDNGSAINILDKEMQQVDFEKMILGYQLSEAKEISSISDLIEYWQNIDPTSSKMRIFIQNFFISFFPLASVMFYIGLGFYNPRYEKNRNTIYAIILTTFYMIAMQKVAEIKTIYMIYIFFATWIAISLVIYRIRIKPHY